MKEINVDKTITGPYRTGMSVRLGNLALCCSVCTHSIQLPGIELSGADWPNCCGLTMCLDVDLSPVENLTTKIMTNNFGGQHAC